jgi:predicted lipoprotein with Yx(FWY)xxD motif
VRTWLPYQGQHPVSGLASDKCAKRWPPEMLLQPGRGLSEETVLLLKKQEQDYLLARVGLPGILWGVDPNAA